MKFSPVAVTGLMAFLSAPATAAPATGSDPAPVDFYKASGMSEMKDGLYRLAYDADGAPRIHFTPPSAAALAIRGSNTTTNTNTNSTAAVAGGISLSERSEGCDNFRLDGQDTDAANADLQAACGDGYEGTVWSQSGDTVAFYCQYASAPRCRARESRNANYWITKKCGRYWAGSYESQGRKYAYGYTDPKRHNFCGIWL
ncbi:uncharacterized protein PG986_001846 [Apiospora aurea]|uniref:Uncharacterized protein n=1 Tax=Apiospora aurea TaxID=335848 RepID=A0ABR1QY53_9PEZI